MEKQKIKKERYSVEMNQYHIIINTKFVITDDLKLILSLTEGIESEAVRGQKYQITFYYGKLFTFEELSSQLIKKLDNYLEN